MGSGSTRARDRKGPVQPTEARAPLRSGPLGGDSDGATRAKAREIFEIRCAD